MGEATEKPGTPFWMRLPAAALSAILLTIANPPADQGWLAWVAPIPFFWALLAPPGGAPSSSARRIPMPKSSQVVWLGLAHGFLFLMLLAPWFGKFSPAGYPVAGIYWGLLSVLVWLACAAALRRLSPAWAPPVLASGWVLWEWLRAQGTLCFPWGTLSVTQHRYLPALQTLDLTGAYGLSWLMALLAASVALGLRPDSAGKAYSRRWTLAAAGAAVLLIFRGGVLLALPQPQTPTVKVAVVQASDSIQEGVAVRCISSPPEYLNRTRQALADGAKLVVWPETARMDDVTRSLRARDDIRELLAGSGANLLTGSFVTHEESRQDQNAGVMFSPDGEVLGTYAKVLIVPFGEYLPLRPWLRWTEQLGMPATDLRPGDGWKPLPWSGGKAGVSICFESAFSAPYRTQVRDGVNVLALLTSDGWVGRTAAGYQHAAFASLRAVETRRSIARAAATGVSQIIDPYGRIIRSIPMFEKGYAVAEAPLRTDLTLHTRLGDWPVGLSAVVLLMAWWVAFRSRAASAE